MSRFTSHTAWKSLVLAEAKLETLLANAQSNKSEQSTMSGPSTSQQLQEVLDGAVSALKTFTDVDLMDVRLSYG